MKLNKNTIDMIVLVLALMLMMLVGGCVGFQNVKIYEQDKDGNLVCIKQVKARIWGLSGQKVTHKDISIEKKDSVDNLFTFTGKVVTEGAQLAKENMSLEKAL